MQSSAPSIPSGNTGTTSTTNATTKKKERMAKIIDLANEIKSTLESKYMPEVTDPKVLELIVRGVKAVARGNVRQDVLEAFNRSLTPVLANEENTASINLTNNTIQELAKLYRRQVELETTMPPPSSFAKHTVWVHWQTKEDAILCFRPNDKKGIPLCVLNDVFREFQLRATAPLPLTADAAKAMNAAYNLCYTMPDSFATEDGRSKAFDICLEPIFQRGLWRKQVPIMPDEEVHGAQVDRIYALDGVTLIIREDNVEPGTGHDVYMQVVRDYQLFVKESREQNSGFFEQGAPVFLLCLLGPILLICGGFHDGQSTIVEPLAEPCLLFDDLLHNRQEVLARQLLALKKAVDALGDRRHVHKIHPAGVPRVYTTYITEDGPERNLTFSRPLESSPPRSLLFEVATDDPRDPSTEKLVKIARKYGAEVHRLLAKSHFAPMLYGHGSLEGAPTAYVMELLRSPANEKPGWVTLWEFFKSKEQATRHSKAIETTLGEILEVMERANMVHGDLRPNNIMLEVHKVQDGYIPVRSGEQPRANLRVVDFDWAGESGAVCYPLQRNQEIAWPVGPGERIMVRHDRDLVKEWWQKQFSLEFQTSDTDMVE
ncbi:hypothetical protein FS837_008564 [Tulasnella sp. UAMH 9824]|nr:hypothetical protein FS837_008564 [Tulasnella sp. UAMH 9824]